MPRRLRRAAVLTISLMTPAARAEPECRVSSYVWELQLVQVAAEAGAPDLRAIATALGSQASLRGGYRDPARTKQPERVELIGSSDGAGLSVSLERAP